MAGYHNLPSVIVQRPLRIVQNLPLGWWCGLATHKQTQSGPWEDIGCTTPGHLPLFKHSLRIRSCRNNLVFDRNFFSICIFQLASCNMVSLSSYIWDMRRFFSAKKMFFLYSLTMSFSERFCSIIIAFWSFHIWLCLHNTGTRRNYVSGWRIWIWCLHFWIMFMRLFLAVES